MAESHDMKGNPQPSLIELLNSQEPDINRIIPAFVSRFNAVYGDPHAVQWDITKEDWQRYEFLGDRVLNLIIAQTLFVQRDAVLDEGEMTEILASVVSNKSLDILTRDHSSLSLLIPRSIGQQKCYGEKITGGAFEAFIGALYCEVGLDDVVYFVNTILAGALENYNPRQNSKGILQEYCQKRGKPLPLYTEMERTGPDHKPTFIVRVTLSDGRFYDGAGHSLSEATKSAARCALEQILDKKE
jgi:ribonuclease III